MPRYKITKRFVYIEELTIHAASAEEAKELALASDDHDNEGRYGDHLLGIDAEEIVESTEDTVKRLAEQKAHDDRMVERLARGE